MERIYQIFESCSQVSTDTRNLPENCLFFALKGENFNGNKFALDALEKGASYAVIDEIEYQQDDRFILVDDVLKTLQELSTHHRLKLKALVIGITGSNGKTTSKELMREVLNEKYAVLATEGNLNNHIGVPLTLLSANKQHEILIVEMGANHIGEIAELCEIARPDYGIITNVGKAHIEGFGSFEGVIKGKKEMYDFVKKKNGHVVINADNKYLEQMLSDFDNKTTYGTLEADVIGVLEESDPFLAVQWGEGHLIKSQLFGQYNVENILLAIAIGNLFDVKPDLIKHAIENYQPANNRSQFIQKDKNSICLDAYNANPSSMKGAIESFIRAFNGPKMVILGDMLELGDESVEEHQKIVDQLNDKRMENIVFVGDQFSKTNLAEENFHFKSNIELCEWLKKTPFEGYTVLIKGSRGICLESCLDFIA